ncbi:putative 5-methylcytosine methyltransferase [Streptomyces venezuelae]|nr:DNA cytosine methyltransferase [Streptomyces gardneri]ALO08666.1 putative 5-methylcytosine methyltransferase [Streptomyces venezuelae]WRK37209.1 DNA cytosine methyltransferase [Streptomyces venezuelae]
MSHIEMEHSPPAGFRILDLFAGPGGLDVAADVLGHRVTGIEWDAGACATRAAAGMDTFQGDVREYRAAFFPRAQVLTGGPPCQTFTVAGHGAGRRALDRVRKYIERLHTVVLDTKECPGDPQAWTQIFRTWRKIHEELRVKELEARAVRAEKRAVEQLRAEKRKAMRDLLEQRGNSKEEVRQLLKKLRAPETLEFPDAELDGLLRAFGDLNLQLDKMKDKLEELGDERTGLVLQPLWWVIERSRRPGSEPYEAVVLEQVPAVMPVWDEYVKVLLSLGYRTETQLMHTEAFGVPQTRRRAVLMARLDRPGLPKGPEPHRLPPVSATHECYQRGGTPARPAKAGGVDTLPGVDDLSSEPPESADATTSDEPPKEGWISMELALENCRKHSSDVRPRPPFTVVSNYGTGGVPEARGRRDHDMPSATITGKVSRNRVVHKDTDKDLDDDLDRFNSAEAGVLQTFPAAYPWSGNDVSQQIGNAVPPRLALHVLRQVLEPELSQEEVANRLMKAVADLEAWRPERTVKPLGHSGLKGHPLASG